MQVTSISHKRFNGKQGGGGDIFSHLGNRHFQLETGHCLTHEKEYDFILQTFLASTS
jgi:hypothetical protein